MALQFTVSATDDKGLIRYYTGRGFSTNPDLAIQSSSLDSADLYFMWGKRDHPTWTDWNIRVSESRSSDVDRALSQMQQRLVTCSAVSEPHSYAVCSCTEGHEGARLSPSTAPCAISH